MCRKVARFHTDTLPASVDIGSSQLESTFIATKACSSEPEDRNSERDSLIESEGLLCVAALPNIMLNAQTKPGGTTYTRARFIPAELEPCIDPHALRPRVMMHTSTWFFSSSDDPFRPW